MEKTKEVFKDISGNLAYVQHLTTTDPLTEKLPEDYQKGINSLNTVEEATYEKIKAWELDQKIIDKKMQEITEENEGDLLNTYNHLIHQPYDVARLTNKLEDYFANLLYFTQNGKRFLEMNKSLSEQGLGHPEENC